jgi:hypothetical protein
MQGQVRPLLLLRAMINLISASSLRRVVVVVVVVVT